MSSVSRVVTERSRVRILYACMILGGNKMSQRDIGTFQTSEEEIDISTPQRRLINHGDYNQTIERNNS